MNLEALGDLMDGKGELAGAIACNEQRIAQIVQQLKFLLGDIKLSNIDALGIGSDWAEAIAFAWLAKQCLHQKTANLAEVTGARGARILGAIYQA